MSVMKIQNFLGLAVVFATFAAPASAATRRRAPKAPPRAEQKQITLPTQDLVKAQNDFSETVTPPSSPVKFELGLFGWFPRDLNSSSRIGVIKYKKTMIPGLELALLSKPLWNSENRLWAFAPRVSLGVSEYQRKADLPVGFSKVSTVQTTLLFPLAVSGEVSRDLKNNDDVFGSIAALPVFVVRSESALSRGDQLWVLAAQVSAGLRARERLFLSGGDAWARIFYTFGAEQGLDLSGFGVASGISF
jgi:hypothetical protein